MSRSPAIRAALWLRRIALGAAVLAFGVVVLGAYVRLTAAGLGCPDWPGCYGHLSPLGVQHDLPSGAALSGTAPDLGKAWREMIHRYAASTLGILIVLLAALALAARKESNVSGRFALALLAIVILQGVLGMLTVTWGLRPIIVTLHLLFGLTTLSLLWWLWLSLRNGSAQRTLWRSRLEHNPAGGRRAALEVLATLALALVGLQIALGGWTSSNYAAIACPDFPQCQASWWPSMDFRDGFVLWRPEVTGYASGVLGVAARTAVHFTHRLGALVTTCVLVATALAVLTAHPRLTGIPRKAAVAVLLALGLQLTIGIFMVLRGFPLWLATAHNAGAALTLLAVLALLFGLRRQGSVSAAHAAS